MSAATALGSRRPSAARSSAKRDRQAGPSRLRGIRTRDYRVIDSTRDHRRVRSDRRAPRALRREGHQPRRAEEAVSPYRFLVERAVEPEVTIGIGGPRVILAGDTGTYSVALVRPVATSIRRTSSSRSGVPEMGINSAIYGLPYVDVRLERRGELEANGLGGRAVGQPGLRRQHRRAASSRPATSSITSERVRGLHVQRRDLPRPRGNARPRVRASLKQSQRSVPRRVAENGLERGAFRAGEAGGTRCGSEIYDRPPADGRDDGRDFVHGRRTGRAGRCRKVQDRLHSVPLPPGRHGRPR